MNILTMGGPGAGKGTISAKVVEKFNVNHIFMGDIFRSKIGEGTALGMEAKSFMDKRLPVPDEVVNSTTKSYLEKPEGRKNGFLLDSYPRILDQAEALGTLVEGSGLTIDKVIVLEIDLEKLAGRVTRCRIHKECGEIYHIKSKPNKIDNVYDICGGELFQRKDDTIESLTVRLEEYSSRMAPVLDYYGSKGIVTGTDASQSIDSV